MILQIAPDYYNTTLYKHLFETLETNDASWEFCIFVCDNNGQSTAQRDYNIYRSNRSFSMIERLLYFPKQNYLLREIERTIPLKQIKLIHAHTLFSSGYVAYKLYKKYGIPYIVAIRNTDVNLFMRFMRHLRPIGRNIVYNAKKIIFISPEYKKYVLSRYLPQSFEEKTTVIPNGIDKLFLDNKSQHNPTTNIIRLIYIGRLEKNKNIDTIIHVSDILIQKGHEVHLCMVGRITNERYYDMIKVREYIEWHDQCSKEEVLSFLRQNDIFLMPSYHETFGLVYAEAMSQGLPLIYTKGQGFDGFFSDGEVGFAVPPNDYDYIIKRILDIQNNYKIISNHCVQNANIFDWQSIGEKYNELYHTYTNS